VKEFAIITWCDHPAHDEEREIAETYLLDLGDGLREIDLCDEHWKMLADARDLLHAVGRKPEQRPKRGRQRPTAARTPGARMGRTPVGPRALACPECGQTYASRSGLVKHGANKHGLDLRIGR